MSDYQKILTGMSRKEVEAVAREFNNTYKISGIGKKKKQDLILELLKNEKLLDEVFNRLYPKGEPVQDIVQKVKKPRKKQQITKKEARKIGNKITEIQKKAVTEENNSAKKKLFDEARKLLNKLGRVEIVDKK